MNDRPTPMTRDDVIARLEHVVQAGSDSAVVSAAKELLARERPEEQSASPFDFEKLSFEEKKTLMDLLLKAQSSSDSSA